MNVCISREFTLYNVEIDTSAASGVNISQRTNFLHYIQLKGNLFVCNRKHNIQAPWQVLVYSILIWPKQQIGSKLMEYSHPCKGWYYVPEPLNQHAVLHFSNIVAVLNLTSLHICGLSFLSLTAWQCLSYSGKLVQWQPCTSAVSSLDICHFGNFVCGKLAFDSFAFRYCGIWQYAIVEFWQYFI